jgi:hypothetical protein
VYALTLHQPASACSFAPQGLTCCEFQALPLEQRSAEDAALHHIVHHKSWKRCPSQGCGHMVECIDGCNYMSCVCGCSFCYAYGVPYVDKAPTAAKSHGTPGCTCALFAVPQEEDEEEAVEAGNQQQQWQQQWQQQQQMAPAPVVLHQADRWLKPWRNGRFVSRTCCRHSASIYNCPNGPNRCWFWHDEDDQGMHAAVLSAPHDRSGDLRGLTGCGCGALWVLSSGLSSKNEVLGWSLVLALCSRSVPSRQL